MCEWRYDSGFVLMSKIQNFDVSSFLMKKKNVKDYVFKKMN